MKDNVYWDLEDYNVIDTYRRVLLLQGVIYHSFVQLNKTIVTTIDMWPYENSFSKTQQPVLYIPCKYEGYKIIVEKRLSYDI